MRLRRSKPLPPLPRPTTTWVDGGSGIGWEFDGSVDYGRFLSYRDSFGDRVVLPTNLIRAIREDGQGTAMPVMAAPNKWVIPE